ncbi:DUF2804 domain-containing protein [Myxococcaceae bacterium JPH2]|nr:DUF2804 domain-containing protein [Myxococcaceae bacterium JPH2]
MAPERDALLPLVPGSLASPAGEPRFGTYQGELAEVDLPSLQGPWTVSALYRLHRARWHSAFVATPEVAAFFSVLNLGYSASASMVAVDLRERKLLCDVKLPGRPIESPAADEMQLMRDRPGTSLGNSLRCPGASLSIHRGSADAPYQMDVDISRIRTFSPHGVRWSGALHVAGAPPGLTVISPVDRDHCRVNVTMKRTRLSSSGSLDAGGKHFSLEGGLGGIDYTQYSLTPHTAWRWAFATGRLEDGTPLGLNLREDFMPEGPVANENALWLGDSVYPLAPVTFEYLDMKLLSPWRVRAADGSVDLCFQPIHVHSENREEPLCRSRFDQPLGLFEGTVTVGGRTHQLSNIPGVTKKQHTTVM